MWGAPWPSEKVRHLLNLYKLALGVDGTQGNKDDSVDQSYFFRTARPLTNFPKPTGKGLTKNVGWLLLHPTSDRKARSYRYSESGIFASRPSPPIHLRDLHHYPIILRCLRGDDDALTTIREDVFPVAFSQTFHSS